MTVLKNPWNFSFSRRSVNQAASSSETAICGIKPISHMIIVLPKYFGTSLIMAA